MTSQEVAHSSPSPPCWPSASPPVATMTTTAATAASSGLSGTINIDGSSTVFPFTAAGGRAIQRGEPRRRDHVGQSGTGGGFEKFCAGETDISDASRPIEAEEESRSARRTASPTRSSRSPTTASPSSTNPALKVSCLTTEQLKQLWNNDDHEPQRARQRRRPGERCPTPSSASTVPGTDSGTFDFFTEKINGEEGVSREDYQPSEDDNVIVQGVAGDEGGLGYFGFSYYEQNADTLNLVSVDAGDGCVAPERGDDPVASTTRSRDRCSCTRATRRCDARGQGVPASTSIDNYEAIAEDALIVPMTDEQAGSRRPTARRLAGGRASWKQRHASVTARRPGAPALGRPRRRRGEEAIRVGLFARGGDLGPDDDRDPLRAAERDDRVLRRGRDHGLHHRRPSGPRCSPTPVRGLAAGQRHAADHRDRDRGRDPARARLGDLPVRVRAPAGPQDVKPILEVLVGIPTVVFGFFALTFVTPVILQDLLGVRCRHLQRARGRARGRRS